MYHVSAQGIDKRMINVYYYSLWFLSNSSYLLVKLALWSVMTKDGSKDSPASIRNRWTEAGGRGLAASLLPNTVPI